MISIAIIPLDDLGLGEVEFEEADVLAILHAESFFVTLLDTEALFRFVFVAEFGLIGIL